MTLKMTRPSVFAPGRSENRTLHGHPKYKTHPAENQITLWPHQVAAKIAVRRSIANGERSGLIAMPTGSGKTTTFASLAKDIKRTTLILVHRDELVTQTIDTFNEVMPGASVGIIKGSLDEWNKGERIVVGSVQSLHQKRFEQIPRNRFKFIVCDECHHAAAPTWRAILNHFQYGYLLGCSATPYRHDHIGLDDIFGDRPIYTYDLRSAIADGVLCDLKQYAVETGTSLDGISVRHGDFAVGELSMAINSPERNKIIIDAYIKRCPDRRAVTVCFNDTMIVE